MSEKKEAGRDAVEPWLAWTRTGPTHRSMTVPRDHGTVDGERTLCGREIGGDERSQPWHPHSTYACLLCEHAFRRLSATT